MYLHMLVCDRYLIIKTFMNIAEVNHSNILIFVNFYSDKIK